MTPEFVPRGDSSLGRLVGRTRSHPVLAGLAVLVLLVVAFWVYRQHAASVAARERAAAANRPVPVRVAPTTQGTVDVTVDALGTVAALNTATIRSRIDGPLLSVPFHEGQLVKAGDVLAQIDPSTFQAALGQSEGQLAKDEAQLAGARVDLDRYTGLLAKDSIATQTVDAQRYMVRQLEGTVRADSAAVATARLQLTFTRITAPFAGRVGLRQVDPGNMVHASDTNGLVVLTQTQPIYVLFAVPSEHLARIYPHWNRGDVLPVDALDRDDKPLAHGKLAAIDNQIDTATGTIKLKAIFDNADNALFPAQFVTARLRTDTLNNVTLAPGAAVQRGAPGTFVYVVGSDNKVALRTVTVGPVSGEQIAIESGLKVGERVVIDGLDKLHDGAAVAVIAPGAENSAPSPPRGQRGRRNGGAPRS
ncbi:MAG: MdtA/MuxA family multidrug efflux RND transporter periplasmic adaptor subunit [Gammaproteobacteria bacterium]|nr:MdtA/MuxA family multidrug efflux RND transporter periplasmic adaptor subunit [Gammaproteobacteria bacterium]MBV9697055.1 MdtA/MuxA family multidrug efflux RND transporter periplasmic adaptor subunit [Gammaproteobacteria bacterium]